MRMFECFGDLLYLAARLGGTVKHRSTYCHSAHVESLIHAGEQRLIVDIGVGQYFVVVDFDDES